MSDDLSLLLDRIRLLVDRTPDEHEADAEAAEHTLTDGYARALALEAERRRTERRVRELAGSVEAIGEQRVLKLRLEQIDDELAELRRLLGALASTLRGPQTIPLRTA